MEKKKKYIKAKNGRKLTIDALSIALSLSHKETIDFLIRNRYKPSISQIKNPFCGLDREYAFPPQVLAAINKSIDDFKNDKKSAIEEILNSKVCIRAVRITGDCAKYDFMFNYSERDYIISELQKKRDELMTENRHYVV